jgi:YVTN family beta-propeller protein
MRRGLIAGVLATGFALVGCSAATLAESGPVAVQGAPGTVPDVTPALPRPTLRALHIAGALPTERPPVADGETARVFPVSPAPPQPDRPLLGPPPPKPAGPAWPVTPVEQAVVPGPVNVYSHITSGQLSPAVADVPLRAYVPNSDAGTVSVIDPSTMKVIDRFNVGVRPHHVTPSWDLTKLYVNNTESNSLTVIDPRSGRPTATIPITDPYNLYFTPDGTKAIVVAERFQRLDFYEASSWNFIRSVSIPFAGVDHADFTADGRYFLASTEFSGQVVKVDTETMAYVGKADVGGLPIDVKLSPDGKVLYVANQGRHGVSIVDVESMAEVGFLKTGQGAHGLNVSRDAATLYVSNRMEGSISVVDFATRTVRETWKLGGSPDMIQVSADGSQLWVSNRFQGSVSVVDTATGKVTNTIPTGPGAHGVSLFPQPGRFNVGHNGVYR